MTYNKLLFTYLFFFLTTGMLYSQSNSNNNFFKQPLDLKIHDINNYSGFEYIDSSIKDSKIIFLGESAHTTKEYSLVKYKLIKYLHEKHNFNIVLFESGLADCFFSNKLKESKDSEWILKHSIFTIWWSETTLALMNYIKSSNITFGGFDYQVSTPYNTNSSFLKLEPIIDTSLTSQLYQADTMFIDFAEKNQLFMDSQNPDFNQYLKLKSDLIKLYEILSSELDKKKSKIDDTDFSYYKRIILNKLFFINTFGNSKKMYELRDSVMSSNILWFCDTIYKNEKIIVWGANEHIAKHNSNIGDFYAAAALPEQIKKESYFIGLYAYSGEMYATPKKIKIKTPKNNSLEGRIHKLANGQADVFIDFRNNYNVDGFEWLKKKTRTYSWGTLIDRIVPVDYYDGVILLNKVSSSYDDK